MFIKEHALHLCTLGVILDMYTAPVQARTGDPVLQAHSERSTPTLRRLCSTSRADSRYLGETHGPSKTRGALMLSHVYLLNLK